ncbi:MAG: response regulator [Synechococcales cyanobacterium RM1_1_8]|nr:response regulator [Synechococcales cyanobacterium RM1_1_8]
MDRFKDEFLAITSHELRTPLSGILGLAESLQAQARHAPPLPLDGTPISAEQAAAQASQQASQERAIELIIFSARRLSTLVNDILDLAKFKHNSLVLECASLPLHRLVQHVLALCEPLAGPKNLRLINAIPEDFPAAYADGHRVQQIFYNLIGNAIKFTPDGEVRVSAQVLAPVRDGGATLSKGDRAFPPGQSQPESHPASHPASQWIAITVSDTGIGIKPELQARIFQAFEQGEQGNARLYNGTGLGLSVVQAFVELHGGRVEARSRPDQGSEFCFTLPMAPASCPLPYAHWEADDSLDTQPQAPPPGLPQQMHPGIESTFVQHVQQSRSPATRPTSLQTSNRASHWATAAQPIYPTVAPTTSVQTAVEPPQALPKPNPPKPNLPKPGLGERAPRPRKTVPVTHPRLAIAPPAAPQRLPLPTPSPEQSFKARILVVDDDAINVEVLQRQLTLEGHEIVLATSGEAALEQLRPGGEAQPFDLVILDVMMPRMSGYEICRRLRLDYPSYRLPVIMLTAKVQVQDVVQGFRVGANDYLKKPFSREELHSRIQIHLNNRLYGRFVPAHFLTFCKIQHCRHPLGQPGELRHDGDVCRYSRLCHPVGGDDAPGEF